MEDLRDDDNMHSHQANLPIKIDKLEFQNIHRTDHAFLSSIFAPVIQAKTMSELKEALSQTLTRVNRLSLFKESSISIQESDVSLDGLKLIFTGEEKRYRVKAGTEVQKHDIAFSFGGFWANVFGRGETLEANASYGSTSTTPLMLSFKKPLFGDPDKIIDLSFVNSTLGKSAWQPFSSKLHQFTISWLFPSKFGMHSLKSSVEQHSLFNFSETASPLMRSQEGRFLRSKLSHSLSIDLRDDRILPTNGHYLKHSIELCNSFPGRGNSGFIKQELYAQIVQPIFKDLSVAVSGHCGMISSLLQQSSSSILTLDRFHMGGPHSIRGFQANLLGPKDGDDCIGGRYISEAALQLSFPLSPATKNIVRGHVFVNSGLLSDELLPVTTMKHHCHSSVGCGVGVNIVGARLELNACYPLTDKRTSPSIQVGIGMDFL
jgi:outer membrane protein insertion porin family